MSVTASSSDSSPIAEMCGGPSPAPHAYDIHVCARLAAGALEYGGESYRRPLAELLAEILEEAADIGAWGSIALSVLAESDLTPAERSTVARAITAAQSQARWAWERLHRAWETIQEGDST